MDETLWREYRSSTYLVCLDVDLWLPIHIGEALLEPLQALVGKHTWGFISAWHPHSIQQLLAENTLAQQQLLATLRAEDTLLALHPGVGIGNKGWYEPSFFVLGLDLHTLDTLGHTYAQNAYVHGRGADLADLREVPA